MGGKRDEIKRSLPLNTYEEGGLKMEDNETFNKSLKLSWLQKYFDDSNE